MRQITNLFIICFSILLPYSSAVASGLSQESAEMLISQINAVMNSRTPSKIISFFDYYIDPAAIILKKSLLVSPGSINDPEREQDLQYNKREYIDYLINITSVKAGYHYNAKLTSFSLLEDKQTAIAGIHIEEVIETTTYIDKTATKIINLVSTNCNMNLSNSGSYPKIMSANCIEKLVFKQ